jgi:PPOX class probable F420-dependent enzyme
MAVEFDDNVRRILEGPNLANVATVGADGAPCVQPTWFDVEGNTIRLNSVEGRAWPKRARRDGRVSLCVVNAEATTEYVEIRGTIVEDPQGGYDHIDVLSRKYIGIDYPNRFPGEERLLFRVHPEKVVYVNLLEAIPAAPFGDQR